MLSKNSLSDSPRRPSSTSSRTARCEPYRPIRIQGAMAASELVAEQFGEVAPFPTAEPARSVRRSTPRARARLRSPHRRTRSRTMARSVIDEPPPEDVDYEPDDPVIRIAEELNLRYDEAWGIWEKTRIAGIV